MEKIEVPDRVVFMNIKNGNVFFDCNPTEARVAKKAIEKFRKGTHLEEYEARAKEIQEQLKKAKEEFENIPASRSVTSMDQLTLTALNQGVITIEKAGYKPSTIFVGAMQHGDVRCWGKYTYEEHGEVYAEITGSDKHIWKADIYLNNGLPDNHVIICGKKGNDLIFSKVEIRYCISQFAENMKSEDTFESAEEALKTSAEKRKEKEEKLSFESAINLYDRGLVSVEFIQDNFNIDPKYRKEEVASSYIGQKSPQLKQEEENDSDSKLPDIPHVDIDIPNMVGNIDYLSNQLEENVISCKTIKELIDTSEKRDYDSLDFINDCKIKFVKEKVDSELVDDFISIRGGSPNSDYVKGGEFVSFEVCVSPTERISAFKDESKDKISKDLLEKSTKSLKRELVNNIYNLYKANKDKEIYINIIDSFSYLVQEPKKLRTGFVFGFELQIYTKK